MFCINDTIMLIIIISFFIIFFLLIVYILKNKYDYNNTMYRIPNSNMMRKMTDINKTSDITNPTNVSDNYQNNMQNNAISDVNLNDNLNNTPSNFRIVENQDISRYINDGLKDPLTPPLKLPYYYNSYPYIAPDISDKVGRFRKIGNLISPTLPVGDRFKFLLLIGRQKQISKRYEYYAITSDANDRLKFYIDKNGREIYHNDNVLIKELNILYEYKEDPSLSFTYDDI